MTNVAVIELFVLCWFHSTV